uniref:Uncharacterized protein n=1 Tax=Anopheles merus TaxID=30066 RepID=A0A182UY40_ANOME
MAAKLKRHDGVVVEVQVLQPIKLWLVTFHVQQVVVRQVEDFERWDGLTVKIERHQVVVGDVQSLQALHFDKLLSGVIFKGKGQHYKLGPIQHHWLGQSSNEAAASLPSGCSPESCPSTVSSVPLGSTTGSAGREMFAISSPSRLPSRSKSRRSISFSARSSRTSCWKCVSCRMPISIRYRMSTTSVSSEQHTRWTARSARQSPCRMMMPRSRSCFPSAAKCPQPHRLSSMTMLRMDGITVRTWSASM